jgi:hypothetical protein
MILSHYKFADIVTSLLKKYGRIPPEWQELPLTGAATTESSAEGAQQRAEGGSFQHGCRPYLQFFKEGKFLFNSTWATRFDAKRRGAEVERVERVESEAPKSQGGAVHALPPAQKALLKLALLAFYRRVGSKPWPYRKRMVGTNEPGTKDAAATEAGTQEATTKELAEGAVEAEGLEEGRVEVGGVEGGGVEGGGVEVGGVEAELDARIERVLTSSSLTPRELQALLKKKYGSAPDLLQVLVLCSCCTRTALVLHSYCTRTALVRHSYCTHTVLIIHSYRTHTVLLTYSYCTPWT